MKLKIWAAGLVFTLVALAAEPGLELFQRAVTQEQTGKLGEAIKLYEKVARDFASDRPLAAKALMRAAADCEKLGQDKTNDAVKLYRQVTSDYGDQPDAANARAKLAMLQQPPPTTMTLRQITPLGSPVTENSNGAYVTFYSDGQHALYLDNNAGGLVFSDLSGSNKRVIFKNTPNRSVIGLVPSRDFSMTDLVVADAAGERTTAVIKSDGTGYREVYKGPRPLCRPSFSWDNHYLLFCLPQPDGGTRLTRISVGDDKIQEVMRGRDIVEAQFSPDGSLIAYRSSAGQLFVVPSQGGEAQLVFDSAQQLLDWTRDGRYLAIVSDRSGATALSLLPVKKGKAAGEPVFVRYGSFREGWTTASGALVYNQLPPKGYYDRWMADLDARGYPGAWKGLNLSGSGNSVAPAWSADGASFAYSMTNPAAGQNTYTVRLRDVVSGKERELYGTSAAPVRCISAAQHASLFCNVYRDGMTELFTLALDSGHVEQIGSLPGIGALVSSSKDDGALYIFGRKDPGAGLGLLRWEIATGRETIVAPDLAGGFPGMISLDERWVAQLNKGAIEVRPMQGAGWRRLVSRRSEIGGQGAFTPDGEWFLYHDKDSSGKEGFYRVSTAGGEPERLGDFPSSNMIGSLFISGNGQKIVAETLNSGPEFWILENYVPPAAK
jgi:Tol biopolymer transport system component